MHGYCIAYFTIVYSGIVRYARSAIQFVLPPIVTSVLYFTIFGKVVGQHIGKIDGMPYIQFIAPGLVMMTIITSTFNSTVGSIFFSKFCRQIEEVVIAPLPTPLLLLGLITVGTLRGLINGILVCIVAGFYISLHFQHLFIAIATALLTATLFSLAAFTNALFAKKWDDISLAPTFIITPITYLGGIFFSIQSLPPLWQKISLYNPMLYVINAFRYGVIGHSDVPVYSALAIVLGCVIALFLFNYYLLSRGIGIRT